MKELDLAYVAGIIDGEGSILLSHTNNSKFRSPVVSVSSTSYELLSWLKTTFGGHICSHKTYKEHHKPHWSWRIASNSAINFLSSIYPYMKEKSKRRRCRLITSLYKSLTLRNGKYSEKQVQDKLRFEKIFLSS